MNDRFKFRFWDKETQTMQKIPMVELRHRITLDKIFADDRVIFMQCTGLKDKNGKLIYEGDIVKYICDSDWCADGYHQCIDCHSGENFKIYWNENFCKFQYSTYDENEFNFDIDEDPAEICLEVIGNIYENKELLQESEVRN